MRKIRYSLILLVFGLAMNSFASQGPEALRLQSEHKERMDFNKKRLDEMQGKLQVIGRILASKEGKLATLNNAKFDLQTEMTELGSQLQTLQSEVMTKQNKISRLIKALVAQRTSPDSSMTMIIVEKTIRENIVKLEGELKDSEQKMIDLKSKIVVVTQNFQNFSDQENSLTEQLKELKDTRSETIVEMSEIEKKIDELLKIKFVDNTSAASGNNRNFSVIMPLESFKESTVVKKGITLRFHESVALLAPANGRVAYLGQLGNLGDVVIIDHGEDYRSILLGKASYTIAAGDEVSKGDVIGHAKIGESAAGGTGQIYFEVRYKNVPKPVSSFIDSKFNVQDVRNAGIAGAGAGNVSLNSSKSVR